MTRRLRPSPIRQWLIVSVNFDHIVANLWGRQVEIRIGARQ